MAKKHVVASSAPGRERPVALAKPARIDRKVFQRAQIPPKAGQAPGGPARPDRRPTDASDASVRTVERLRQRFLEAGPDGTLRPAPTPRSPRKIDGAARARVAASARSEPPPGFARLRPASPVGA